MGRDRDKANSHKVKERERDSEKERVEKEIAMAETYPGFSGRFGTKPYKAPLAHLFATTHVKPRHVDEKAVMLLDALAERGKAEEACNFLSQTLDGYSRHHISNWRAYIYTLLRGYDDEAYRTVKASQSAAKRKRVTDRRGVTPSSEASPGAQDDEDEKAEPAAEEDEEGRALADVLAATDSEGSDAGKKRSSRAAAAGTSLSQLISDPSAVREFVPKQTPIKLSAHTGVGGEDSRFRHTAPEFVPGFAWNGLDSTSSSAQMRSEAQEFVPGRPWGDSEAAGGKKEGLARATGTAPPAVIAASAAQAAAAAAAAAATSTSAAGDVSAPRPVDSAAAKEKRGTPAQSPGAEQESRLLQAASIEPLQRWLGPAAAASVLGVAAILLLRSRR